MRDNELLDMYITLRYDSTKEIERLRSYIAHNIGDEYRQCLTCGSIDFTFKFHHTVMECKCVKCSNLWIVEIE